MMVTFVIPVLTFSPILVDTLRAITLLQGLNERSWEIILIQNGPVQTVPKWVNTFSNLRVVHSPFKSIPKARNLGSSLAKYELIAFFDEDSVCPPEWLKEGLEYMKCDHIGVFQSPAYTYKNVARLEERFLKNRIYFGLIYFDTAASLFRREALLDVAGFDESFKKSEDLDIAKRLAHFGWTIAYGSSVVGGENEPSLFQVLKSESVSAYYFKRLCRKFGFKFKVTLFASNVRWFMKKSILPDLVRKLVFWVVPPLRVSEFKLKAKTRFLLFFTDRQGKISPLTAPHHLLVTRDSIIFLLDGHSIAATKDSYLYELLTQSEKLMTVELGKIQDEKFLAELGPFLRCS